MASARGPRYERAAMSLQAGGELVWPGTGRRGGLMEPRVLKEKEPKPKPRKIVQSEARAIIAKVFHYLKQELEVTLARNPQGCDLAHLRNVRQRTADATGSSVRTVTRILREEKELSSPNDKFPSPRRARPKKNFPNFDKYMAEVVRTIQDYKHEQKELPGLRELKIILAKKIGYNGSLATLRQTVLDLGYKLNVRKKPKLNQEMKEERSGQDEGIAESAQMDWCVGVQENSETTKEDPTMNVEVVYGVDVEISEVKEEPASEPES